MKQRRNGSGSAERFKPRTELGRTLLALRKKILASGKGLSSWDAVEREVNDRRGAAPAR